MAYDALVERNIAKPRAKVFAAFHDFGGIKKILPDAIKSCEFMARSLHKDRFLN